MGFFFVFFSYFHFLYHSTHEHFFFFLSFKESDNQTCLLKVPKVTGGKGRLKQENVWDHTEQVDTELRAAPPPFTFLHKWQEENLILDCPGRREQGNGERRVSSTYIIRAWAVLGLCVCVCLLEAFVVKGRCVNHGVNCFFLSLLPPPPSHTLLTLHSQIRTHQVLMIRNSKV